MFVVHRVPSRTAGSSGYYPHRGSTTPPPGLAGDRQVMNSFPHRRQTAYDSSDRQLMNPFRSGASGSSGYYPHRGSTTPTPAGSSGCSSLTTLPGSHTPNRGTSLINPPRQSHTCAHHSSGCSSLTTRVRQCFPTHCFGYCAHHSQLVLALGTVLITHNPCLPVLSDSLLSD